MKVVSVMSGMVSVRIKVSLMVLTHYVIMVMTRLMAMAMVKETAEM